MDAVSHLLRLARVDASLNKRCLLATSTGMDVSAHGPREAPFHVLLDGHCRIRIGTAVVDLQPGDVVVIPSGAPHRVTTMGRGRLQSIVEKDGDAFTTTRSKGGGTPVIDLFCGRYTFGAGAGSLLFRSLPEPLHVRFGDSAEGSEVLQMLSVMMRNEARSEGDGSAAILSALCTVLLAMVLRSTRGAMTDTRLWTAAGEARVAATIDRVLADPGADWSIDRLSRAAAMSRATFLRHFADSTGMTIGTFLTQTRMMAAAELLRSSDLTVATVANQVGYRSESAFSRTFRDATGSTPARFRREASAQWVDRRHA